MKDKKRIIISIFVFVLLACFILAACGSNRDISGKAIMGNTPTAPSIEERSLTGKENILSNIAPVVMPDSQSKAVPAATPDSQSKAVPAATPDSQSKAVPAATPDSQSKAVPTATPDNQNQSAPATEDAAENEGFESYDDVIAEWKADLILHLNDEDNIWIKKNPTFEFRFYNGYTDEIQTYYALYDIDGNGVTELLLKRQTQYEDIIGYIFSLKEGIPVNLFGYDDQGLPCEVPWSRSGYGKILDNGLIDCLDGNYAIYKMAENGYSVIKFAAAEPYDYPSMAQLDEAKWRHYIYGTEVEEDFYLQSLEEQGYQVDGDNVLADINWISLTLRGEGFDASPHTTWDKNE